MESSERPTKCRTPPDIFSSRMWRVYRTPARRDTDIPVDALSPSTGAASARAGRDIGRAAAPEVAAFWP
ncbi:hypothetical protein GCM10010435_72190 [Winogradskya consettensis]|uniref:Uncharacterized protein n=1 Tax=Winogradskya consettensis TaxID=113560 RepID=A0A919W6I3_9ACTN|nr:hypothetical protein Aco04nite_87090 [Actinoplanes consettensis]